LHIGSLEEVLSDQMIRWCCINRLSRQGLSECGNLPDEVQKATFRLIKM
jgi:hypothetical protein